MSESKLRVVINGGTEGRIIAASADCPHGEAVKWNPYNECVQCHRCGHIFVPANYEKQHDVPTDPWCTCQTCRVHFHPNVTYP